MKRIYIAHPLYGDGSQEWGNPERNIQRYLRFCARASNGGDVVVSWLHHYIMETNGLTPHGSADFYLSRDERLVVASHELWVCGPRAVSAGMRFEIKVAVQHAIRVIHRPEWDDPAYLPAVTGDYLGSVEAV